MLWSKSKMSPLSVLLRLASLSIVYCEHEAAVATPEQIAIAATGKLSQSLVQIFIWLLYANSLQTFFFATFSEAFNIKLEY